MSGYRLFEADQYIKELERIKPPHLQEALQLKFKQYVYPLLKKEPHFGTHIKKLKGFKPETWRFRIGSWRLFYFIDEADKVVVLTSLQKRNEAYR